MNHPTLKAFGVLLDWLAMVARGTCNRICNRRGKNL